MFLVRRHRPWLSNAGKRLVRSPKAYVTDSGMLCAMQGADAEGLVRSDDLAGRAMETFVAMELVRQASFGTWPTEVLHFRDGDQREVDIVLERPGGAICAIEVKAGATVTAADFAGIRAHGRLAGERLVVGVVLYAGASTVAFGDGRYAVPISALWS